MMTALLALLAVSPIPAVAAQGDDPPVQVWLDDDGRLARGARARVHVRAQRDGYLVVLRADAAGRVRVLFPLDPGDDSFVRGGRKLEVRGRGDRDAFFVDDREGSGLVLAAWSPDALRFDEFTRGDHWDYRSLGAGTVADDPEAGLLEVARRMAGGNPFEYDVAEYIVGDGHWGSYSWPRHRYGASFRVGFGYPYYGGFYDPFYDPFFFSPSCWDPWFCYASYFGYYYRYRPFGYRYGYYRPIVTWPYVGGRPLAPGRGLESRERDLVQPVEPRRRPPAAAPAQERRRPEARSLERVRREVAPRGGARSFDRGGVPRSIRPARPDRGRGGSLSPRGFGQTARGRPAGSGYRGGGGRGGVRSRPR